MIDRKSYNAMVCLNAGYGVFLYMMGLTLWEYNIATAVLMLLLKPRRFANEE